MLCKKDISRVVLRAFSNVEAVRKTVSLPLILVAVGEWYHYRQSSLDIATTATESCILWALSD